MRMISKENKCNDKEKVSNYSFSNNNKLFQLTITNNFEIKINNKFFGFLNYDKENKIFRIDFDFETLRSNFSLKINEFEFRERIFNLENEFKRKFKICVLENIDDNDYIIEWDMEKIYDKFELEKCQNIKDILEGLKFRYILYMFLDYLKNKFSLNF